MRNYSLIRQVRDHIVANPNEHNQDQWGIRTPCKTTHCAAGHAVIIAGARPIWEVNGDHYQMYGAEWRNRRWSTGELAQHLLGLTDDEADELFYGFDDAGALDMLDRFVKEGE